MSNAAPERLLHRDRAELDRVAMLLRDGRTVAAFIVCRPSLWPAVLDYLRAQRPGYEIPDPVTPADGQAMLDLLHGAVKQPPETVVSFALPREASPLHDTLNLHREKLRKGASKLVFIDGAEGMNTLRAIGPDAYTFRDVMAFLVGEPPPVPVAPEEEPDELRYARERYRRAMRERAHAAWALGQQLRVRLHLGEAERVLRAALDGLGDPDFCDDADAVLRAKVCGELCFVANVRGARAEASRWVARGLSALEGRQDDESRGRRCWLNASRPGPYAIDRRALLAAIEDMRLFSPDSDTRGVVLLSVVGSCRAMGNLRAAARTLAERSAISGLHPINQALGSLERARIELAAGRTATAQATAQSTTEAYLRAGASPAAAQLAVAESLLLRGEGEAARRTLLGMALSEGSREVRALLAVLAVSGGDVLAGMSSFRTMMHEAAARGADWDHYVASEGLTAALVALHRARGIHPGELSRADTDLEVAEDISLAMVGVDPPWYTIQFPFLRSELFALRPDRLPDALRLSALALERAQSSCPELAPRAARAHGRNLLRADRLPEALETLSLAESEARREGNLRELASAQRLSLVALLRAGRPTDDLTARLADLRQTLESTGSPRITAENLLELAHDLPPETTAPDPLALVEEALTLFRDMPIPEKEALCHETAGDILLARGRPEEARRRYLTARRRLERHNLGLRLPLLQSKVDGIPPAT